MARIVGKGYSFDDILMVPKYNKVSSRKEVSFKTKVTRNYSLDMPLIAANMDTVCDSKMAIALGRLGGLGVIHRFMTIEQQVEEVKRVKAENLICAVAIGVKDYRERVEALSNVSVDILVLDVAHGHSKRTGKTLDCIKENYSSLDVMVGNIATKDAAKYFLSKGADAVKVGVGPGSMCITRGMSGVGVPQVTAIMDVYEETQGEIPICADGGIRVPGDVSKAIGAGADTVMSGNIFAGTEESPGEVLGSGANRYKDYRGMASYGATMKKLKLDGEKHDEIIHVEGESTQVPYKGPVKPIVEKFLGGLASGMTYIGANEISKIKGKADFIEMTNAGLSESKAHGLT